jgi:hypothetical protein
MMNAGLGYESSSTQETKSWPLLMLAWTAREPESTLISSRDHSISASTSDLADDGQALSSASQNQEDRW